jgi:PilZ domain-containing protein
MTYGNEERRKFPRIKDKDISIQIRSEGFQTITQSLDVSASGIYCKMTERIPLMTRLEIVLALPNKKKDAPPILMHIEGVVVREHPVLHEGRVAHYDVAIFFNNLMPKERDKLSSYIKSRSG